MKTFQKSDGSLWAFELDGSQDDCITEDMVSLTEEQAEAIRYPQKSLAELKFFRLVDLNEIAQRLADGAIADYPKAETLSWPDQANEAMAWASDHTSPTPYMDALALSRGLDRAEHLNRTVAKVSSFKAFSAHVFGTRQKFADQIDAATNEAELNAIVFNFA